MPTRRTLLLCAASFAVAGNALAQTANANDGSPLAFITSIYSNYKGESAPTVPLDTSRAISKYFEPKLADAMIKDKNDAHKRGDEWDLDYDPFIYAQDLDAKDYDIAVTNAGPGKAQARVKFVNLRLPTTCVYDLVKVESHWRIYDIAWTREGKTENLRKIFMH